MYLNYEFALGPCLTPSGEMGKLVAKEWHEHDLAN